MTVLKMYRKALSPMKQLNLDKIVDAMPMRSTAEIENEAIALLKQPAGGSPATSAG